MRGNCLLRRKVSTSLRSRSGCVIYPIGARVYARYSEFFGAAAIFLFLNSFLPSAQPVRALYRFYLHQWVPFLGSTLTNQKNAYDYLGESIENFPSGNAMLQSLMKESGFEEAAADPLTAGIVTIYTGRKK